MGRARKASMWSKAKRQAKRAPVKSWEKPPFRPCTKPFFSKSKMRQVRLSRPDYSNFGVPLISASLVLALRDWRVWTARNFN